MKTIAGALVLSIVAVMLPAHDAHALTQFKKAFTAKYVTKHKSAAFKTLARKASCNTCHVKGEKKSRLALNHYATELEKLIEGDANARKKKAKADGGLEADKKELAKLLDELDKAFKKVEDMKAPTGETFGELLKEGKLPVDPEWAKAEYQKKKAAEENDK